MNMIMRSTAAVAFLDSGATAAETMGPSGHPDAELITIASAAINLSRLCDEANAVADNLREPFYERRPERPTELKARPTDGGITHISYERDHRTEAEHSNKCWCRVDDREALSSARQMKWEFIGSDEDWGNLKTNQGNDPDNQWLKDEKGNLQPPKNEQHLWEWRFAPHLQQRADEILKAHDRHTADINALRAELGLDVAEAHANHLFAQLRILEWKIEKLSAKTIDGLRAKAEVVAHVCWGGEILRGYDTTDRRIMASIMSDLTGLPDDRPYDPETEGEAA
jgi:hypothetical protein